QFIQWGKVHVLDTTQGLVIKRIYDAGDSIRCNSFNPDYPDFEIPKNEIYFISLVVGLLRL
ncbi:MAG: helix-turn-helix transcriptional regulator, partial [Prevotella sp.]|nr:helix-turn-helix transcriptional regulator [Prevotella sp.]